ncbi:MAG: electron transfer flavoprotein subunit beta/FixA family protein [Nocardioidaceae bacterium]|nr:electron transfer flavoprotein subunit beta/FixA family protein [Nocardioidaceae bacterium]MDQ3324814.1 electron transfer flavoprotein subunit beta/FixA family protein [Actinomycetota bacterium]
MTDVLVCIKRVPGASGEVLLSDDGQRVDARHVGWTLSAHEECAIELATQVAGATGGTATVLTVGSADAIEQLRDALALGCDRAVLVEAETDRFGPVDVAAAIAEVVRAHEAAGTSYGLVLLGNDAADTGDFQVPVRLAYALARPVVTGIATCTVEGDLVVAHGDGPDGPETFELPVPAVVAVMEGGVAPRYPSVMGRMKAKKVAIEQVAAEIEPVGSGRVRLTLPPEQPSQVQVLGQGADAAPAVVDLLEELGMVSR